MNLLIESKQQVGDYLVITQYENGLIIRTYKYNTTRKTKIIDWFLHLRTIVLKKQINWGV